jgi:protein-disulfide isomerase
VALDHDLTSAPVSAFRPGDHVRGARGEPAVLFADLTCPRCAVVHLRLREEDRRVAFRHFALKARHPRAVPVAHAAEAAGAQGAFWAFADAVFADQGHVDDPHLWALAERLGLDLERFEADRRGAEAAGRVSRDTREALRAGVTGTPALVTPGLD